MLPTIHYRPPLAIALHWRGVHLGSPARSGLALSAGSAVRRRDLVINGESGIAAEEFDTVARGFAALAGRAEMILIEKDATFPTDVETSKEFALILCP